MKTNAKTKILFLVMIAAILIAMVTPVFAADYSVAMALTSSSYLKEGETVTVKVNLTSIVAGDGIDAIAAQLNYDENVFEAVSISDMTVSAGWTPSYAATTKMMTLLKNEKVKTAENVLTINFKVKSTISVDSTTIKLQEITASGGRVEDNGTGDIEVKDAQVTISRQKETTPVVQNNTVVKDNTVTKTTTLPKTGLDQFGVVAIVVVAIVGIFSFALYKKIPKIVK